MKDVLFDSRLAGSPYANSVKHGKMYFSILKFRTPPLCGGGCLSIQTRNSLKAWTFGFLAQIGPNGVSKRAEGTWFQNLWAGSRGCYAGDGEPGGGELGQKLNGPVWAVRLVSRLWFSGSGARSGGPGRRGRWAWGKWRARRRWVSAWARCARDTWACGRVRCPCRTGGWPAGAGSAGGRGRVPGGR